MAETSEALTTAIEPRKSVIELLKIIAIILTIISHVIPYYNSDSIGYLNIRQKANSMQQFIIVVFRYIGQIGNKIFIIC